MIAGVPSELFNGMVENLREGFLMDFLDENPERPMVRELAMQLRAFGCPDEAIRLARKAASILAISYLALMEGGVA